jgi:hypothetical protein
MKRWLSAVFLLASVVAAQAATLISTATGNINATGTWSVVDTTGTNAYLNSEATPTALTTTPVASSTFTPAAETLTAIGVKLASVAASPSGTLTIKLANSTSAGNRECTQTVNVTDLVAAAATTAEGGWVILTCAASPNGTDNYTINANTSVGAQINLFSLATTNWSRLLVTSGTQTNGPAAGDKFIVEGQLTGAGTHNAYTVTINTTVLVNYGNVANTLIDPSVTVGQWGTLQFASAASTTYVSEFAGPAVVYNGGTFSVGTSGTPIPSTSSATLTLNSIVEGDTGINVRNGGTFNSAGSAGGRNVVKTKLTAAATGGSTSVLTTADTTGWLSGDSIYVAGTATTASTLVSYKGDVGTLSGNASGTGVTLTGAVTNTHTATQLSGTSSQTGIAYALNMYADVVLLNRNVIIKGSGTTTNGYLYFQAAANGAMTWTEFAQISGAAAGQRGIEVDVGYNGSFSLTNFSIHDSHDATMVLAPTNTDFGGTAGAYLTIQHGVFYNDGSNPSSSVSAYGMAMLTPSANPHWKFDDIAFILVANGTYTDTALSLTAVSGQFSNISITGSGSPGNSVGAISLNTPYNSRSIIGGGVGNTFGPITEYANIGWVLTGFGYGITGTVSGWYIWHEQGRFNWQGGSTGGPLIIDPFYVVTNSFGVYLPAGGSNFVFRNGIIGWDQAGANSTPITMDSEQPSGIFLDNMEICPTGTTYGVTWFSCSSALISLMQDIAATGGYNPSNSQVFLRNTALVNSSNSLAGYPTMGGQEGFYSNGFVVQDCNACTPVKHAAWVRGGFLSYDTASSCATCVHTSGYSERMTPRVQTVSGYIVGTTLTLTSGTPATPLSDFLTSNAGSGFVPGTLVTSGSGTSYVVTPSQTVGSAGSPVQFQNYGNTNANALIRLQSAPLGMGIKVTAASGTTVNVCVWLRPSISTDAAPPWGGSAVTYNGDSPRMLVRQNPYMGVNPVGGQPDTVMTYTNSPSFTAGTWTQACATTPSAPADGEFEIVVDADQTFTSNAGGWINVGEWSATGQGN